LDEIHGFGWTKNDVLDNIFLVSLNTLVAKYKISAEITSILTFQ